MSSMSPITTLLASACAANDQTEARTAPEIDMIQLRDFISNSLHGGCVMHGLDPCVQGRRPRIIVDGAAWMPGSRPGMTRTGLDSVVLARLTEPDRHLSRIMRQYR